MYKLSNGMELIPGQQFSIGDTKYPSNWLSAASQDDLVNLGITYSPDPTPTPTPDPAPSLPKLQADKILDLTQQYKVALQKDVDYMGTTFQADLDSQNTLSKSLAGMGGTAPPGFYWVDSSNAKVAMTFSQCQGLAAVMFNQGWAAFQNLQNKKDEVDAATIDTIGDITW